MKIRKGAVGTAVAAAILTATACQEDIVVPEPDPHVATVASLRSAGRLDYDGHMAQMAADLPGFAGYYSDGEEFVVRMKGAEHSDEVVRGAVSDFIERRTSRRARPAAIAQRVSRVDRMVVRPATYDFLELYTWQRRILSMDWPVGTLSYLDIDEVENTIQVGVAEPTAVRTIHQAIRELGVPPAAFDVRARPRGRLHLGLQNQITNEVGGIQIEVWNGLGFCSLGFNLDYSGDSEEYFVTAAHCTSDDASIGEVEGNYAHQPTTSHGTIGDEVADPDLFTNTSDSTCPAGDDCRYSDAALFEYNSFASPLLGEVADAGVGSTTYTNTNLVIGEFDPDVGDYVEMTGRTSGRVNSEISDTCVHYPIVDNETTYLCQFIAEDTTASGDSGGPVLEWFAPLKARNFYAVGLIVGRADDDDGPYAGTSWGDGTIISGMAQILDELEADFGSTLSGDVDLRPDPNVSINSGPYTLPSGLYCTWTASASGGVPAYTHAWSGKLSGTGSSIEGVINSSGYLTVTVTDDAGHTDSASRWITINESAPAPPGCTEEQQQQ